MNRRLTQWGIIAAAIAIAVITGWRGDAIDQERADGPTLSDDPPFDFFVLALSWSPTYCASDAGQRSPLQCGPGADFGFITHGLWPQFEQGWPSFCQSPHGDRMPDQQVGALLSIMPDRGLIQHQWDKHGTCSALSPADYATVTRQATDQIVIPESFADESPARMNASSIEAAFLAANPDLTNDALAVTCPNRRFAEVRICLDTSLHPRACEEVDRNGCQATNLTIPAR